MTRKNLSFDEVADKETYSPPLGESYKVAAPYESLSNGRLIRQRENTVKTKQVSFLEAHTHEQLKASLSPILCCTIRVRVNVLSRLYGIFIEIWRNAWVGQVREHFLCLTVHAHAEYTCRLSKKHSYMRAKIRGSAKRYLARNRPNRRSTFFFPFLRLRSLIIAFRFIFSQRLNFSL